MPDELLATVLDSAPLPTPEQWRVALAVLLRLDWAFHIGESGILAIYQALDEYDAIGWAAHETLTETLHITTCKEEERCLSTTSGSTPVTPTSTSRPTTNGRPSPSRT